MKLLLDTHILLWWLRDNPKLGSRTRAVISAPEAKLMVSVASLWELSIKARYGKIVEFDSMLHDEVQNQGIHVLGVDKYHLSALEKLPKIAKHSDPFDHLILAQAMAEDAVLVTSDRWMRHYPVRCI